MSKVFIICKNKCKYCDLAIQLLDQKGIGYLKKVFGVDYSQSDIDDIKDETGAKTYPIIFIDSKYIGGYSELCGYDLKPAPAGSDGEKFEISDDF